MRGDWAGGLCPASDHRLRATEGGGWNSCWRNPAEVVDGERARYRQRQLLALGRNEASSSGTFDRDKVSASRDRSDDDDNNDNLRRHVTDVAIHGRHSLLRQQRVIDGGGKQENNRDKPG